MAGRPKHASTKLVPIVMVQPSRCPACGSDRRSKYGGTNPFTGKRMRIHRRIIILKTLVWRRCVCLNCGQERDDETVYNYVLRSKVRPA